MPAYLGRVRGSGHYVLGAEKPRSIPRSRISKPPEDTISLDFSPGNTGRHTARLETNNKMNVGYYLLNSKLLHASSARNSTPARPGSVQPHGNCPPWDSGLQPGRHSTAHAGRARFWQLSSNLLMQWYLNMQPEPCNWFRRGHLCPHLERTTQARSSPCFALPHHFACFWRR